MKAAKSRAGVRHSDKKEGPRPVANQYLRDGRFQKPGHSDWWLPSGQDLAEYVLQSGFVAPVMTLGALSGKSAGRAGNRELDRRTPSGRN